MATNGCSPQLIRPWGALTRWKTRPVLVTNNKTSEVFRMSKGVVRKWLKSYGFISPAEKGKRDIFVHFSEIKAAEGEFRQLHEGDQVQFEVMQGERGPYAANVSVLQEVRP